jgi:hypothetical protein
MITNMSKDEINDMLIDYFNVVSSKKNSKELAEESLKIMNDNLFKQIVIARIIEKHLVMNNQLPNHIENLICLIATSLHLTFKSLNNKEEFGDLKDLFLNKTEEQIIQNKRLSFALSQFANAFYHFEAFEKSYPNLSKEI